MVQFNLLPDVKIAYMKAKRVKRLVMLGSVLVTSAVIGLVVLLVLVVNVWGKATLADLDKDAKKEVTNLKSIQDIDKILTIQNQLISLPGLHAQKPISSRVFSYVSNLTPTAATIAKITVNFEAKTIELTGGADKIETINKYVDTIKFTTYKVNDASTDTPKAFSNVVLESFGRDNKSATYKITFAFDQAIFDRSNPDIKLVVPKIITTRSQTEQPGQLIDSTKAPDETKPTGNGGKP